MKKNTTGMDNTVAAQKALEKLEGEPKKRIPEDFERIAEMISSSTRKEMDQKSLRRRSQKLYAKGQYEPPKWWRGTRV